MAEETIRVLLIEDNPADARLLQENLVEPAGPAFRVTHVGRVAEAAQCLLVEHFDLILLDLSLPDSDSLDTVRRIHRDARRTPIVVLTGFADEARGVEAVRQGAQDYLVKGQADRRLLVRAIRYALERHRTEEELARYRDSLEELVAARTAALETANIALQQEIAERLRAEEALASARRKLATDRERQRLLLASELHDSIGQELIAMKFALERVLTDSKVCLDAQPAGTLSGAIEKCVSLIREVRSICHGLYPPALQSFGLAPALRQLADECQAPAQITVFHSHEVEAMRFPPEVEIALFRIAQEAFQNAIRHSRAGHIALRLGYEDGSVTLSIVDDGVGFDPAHAAGKGLGFISMRERAVTAGGVFGIASRPGETRVEVRIPSARLSPSGAVNQGGHPSPSSSEG